MSNLTLPQWMSVMDALEWATEETVKAKDIFPQDRFPGMHAHLSSKLERFRDATAAVEAHGWTPRES